MAGTDVSGTAPLPVCNPDGSPVGGGGTSASPTVTTRAQGTPTAVTITLTAATAATLLTASATRQGARILNWTAAGVYVTTGTTGTPASGAPSDYIPAAVSGVPGQYEPPFAPVAGLRAVGASAGDLTVVSW